MLEVATKAKAGGKTNVAFMCFFLCGMTEECVDLLCDTGRVPEAALFARTYAPSLISKVLPLWRKELKDGEQPKLAEALADPNEYANLFPNWETALLAEQLLAAKEPRPATDYPFVDEEDPMEAANAALADVDSEANAADEEAVDDAALADEAALDELDGLEAADEDIGETEPAAAPPADDDDVPDFDDSDM